MWIQIAATSLVFLCLTAPPTTTWAEDDMQAVKVIVEGAEPPVYKFHVLLKEKVSAEFGSDFGGETTPVSCLYFKGTPIDCKDLPVPNENSTRPLKLEYLTFRDNRHMSLFLQAWARLVDIQYAHDKIIPIKVTFEVSESGGDCTDAGSAKQPCVNAAQCPYTTPRRCDRYLGPPCSSCGTP